MIPNHSIMFREVESSSWVREPTNFEPDPHKLSIHFLCTDWAANSSWFQVSSRFLYHLRCFPFRDDSIIMQGGLKPNHLNWDGMHDVLWLVQSTAHCARLKLN